MDAVLGIYMQTGIFPVCIAHDFVHAGRAVALLGRIVELEVDLDRHRGIVQGQVHRLVFIVVGVRDEHRRQPVEGDHTVGFGVGDRLCLLPGHERLVVGVGVVQRPRRVAAERDLVNAGHQRAGEKTLAHPRLEVARAV